MLPDPRSDLSGRQALRFVDLDVFTQPVLDEREIAEPASEFRRGVNPREILVPLPKPKPAAHLHERIVGHAPSDKEADQQPFQREATREPVSSNGDRLQRRLSFIIQNLAGGAVDLAHLYGLKKRADILFDLFESRVECRMPRPRDRPKSVVPALLECFPNPGRPMVSPFITELREPICH